MVKNKNNNEKSLRLKSDSNGSSNTIKRVSSNFKKMLDSINDKRKQNGFDELSFPKMTELIIKHKKFKKLIGNDLVHYNTTFENKEDENEE